MLSVSASALARLVARTSRPAEAAAATARRGLSMKVREVVEPLPDNFSMDAIQPPPHGFGDPYPEERDPMHYDRKPVTSAHAIDLSDGAGSASALDSAAFGPNGTVVHGRFGEVAASVAETVPLEYLALLRPASEGAAALREISEASGSAGGTVLVYGASRPAGMAAAQLATAAGHAVVAVLDGGHSGNDDMVNVLKGLVSEPGTAVAEEYALSKANFRDLVQSIVSGEDDFASKDLDTNKFLSDFKTNLLDYIEAYPSDLPAAVDSKELMFMGKEKDRANFKANMTAYLSQFPPGADPIDPAQLDANFDIDKYEVFKKQFGIQTTAVISGGDEHGTNTDRFAPAEIARNMCYSQDVPKAAPPKEGDHPFEFNIKKGPPALEPSPAGGPIVGAVIEVTPDLLAACKAVDAGKTLREKAEALQFLTEAQKNAHAAASSVVALARKAGATIRTVGGSLPGLEEIQKPGDADVQTALKGMELGADGTSKLNYFIQVYRAGDWPVYEAYAIHRAKEPLSGPRQLIITK